MSFAAFFVHQCGPLLATALVGLLAWAVIKPLLRSRGRGTRRFARQQSLWSNWT